MERDVLFVFCVLFASAVAPPPETSKTYRSDYEYNKNTDAFYKLHIEPTRAYDAARICEVEGSQLMIPSSKFDPRQVHSMLKKFPDIGDSVWVGDDGQKHESAEETPLIDLTNPESSRWEDASTCDVVTRNGDIETTRCLSYERRPFVCKVSAKDAPYDSQCGVYASKYIYISSVGSCYKVPHIAYTWDQAYSECSLEGAHLVVLNSAAERDAVKEFLKTVPSVPGALTTYFFFAGIRANHPTDGSARVFKTVFNETLEAAGFNEWSDGEPNNWRDSEYCGTIFSNNGQYNDVNCASNFGFICEKEVHL